MQNTIKNLWNKRAANKSISLKEDGYKLVLDSSDHRGFKNEYIDHILKKYIKQYLAPQPTDTVLEIGSGVGRLTEYIAPLTKKVYGVDIAQNFVHQCQTNPNKCDNTVYETPESFLTIPIPTINKMYCVWVLMFFEKDEELIDTIAEYNQKINNGLECFLVLEQTSNKREIIEQDGKFFCCHRTIEEFEHIFFTAGFELKKKIIIKERNHGIIFKLLFNRYSYKILPNIFYKHLNFLLRAEHFLMNKILPSSITFSPSYPYDTLFILAPKKKGET